MKELHMATFLLMFVGGLNWGFVGLFDYNLVTALLGGYPGMEKLVYVLVGAASVYVMVTHKGDCRICASSAKK